jgi:hypothetical protein
MEIGASAGAANVYEALRKSELVELSGIEPSFSAIRRRSKKARNPRYLRSPHLSAFAVIRYNPHQSLGFNLGLKGFGGDNGETDEATFRALGHDDRAWHARRWRRLVSDR